MLSKMQLIIDFREKKTMDTKIQKKSLKKFIMTRECSGGSRKGSLEPPLYPPPLPPPPPPPRFLISCENEIIRWPPLNVFYYARNGSYANVKG